jgi:hypothetical protein
MRCARHPEPDGVRPLGVTRHRMDALCRPSAPSLTFHCDGWYSLLLGDAPPAMPLPVEEKTQRAEAGVSLTFHCDGWYSLLPGDAPPAMPDSRDSRTRPLVLSLLPPGEDASSPLGVRGDCGDRGVLTLLLLRPRHPRGPRVLLSLDQAPTLPTSCRWVFSITLAREVWLCEDTRRWCHSKLLR